MGNMERELIYNKEHNQNLLIIIDAALKNKDDGGIKIIDPVNFIIEWVRSSPLKKEGKEEKDEH